MGIILVVVGHVLRGIENASIPVNETVFGIVDRAIYIFHMPLFFLIAGYLFASTRNRNFSSYLTHHATRLLWPLAFWTWIYFAFKVLAGGLANNPAGLGDFPWLPLPPREQFWFLWALFVVQLLAFGVRALAPMHASRLRLLVCVFVAACAIRLWVPLPDALSPYFSTAIVYFPIFLVGVLIRITRAIDVLGRSFVLPFCVFVGCEIAAHFAHGNTADLFLGTATAAAVVLLIVWGESKLEGRGFNWLERLGQASLAIFVSHVIFIATMRIALIKLGVTSVSLHIALGTAVGILAPFALYRIAIHFGIAPFLGFEAGRRHGDVAEGPRQWRWPIRWQRP